MYDLLTEDLEWLEQYNKDNRERCVTKSFVLPLFACTMRDPFVFALWFFFFGGYRLTEDAMEALIDVFERESSYVSPEVDCTDDFPLRTATVVVSQQLNLRGAYA